LFGSCDSNSEKEFAMTDAPFWLSDAQFARLEVLLPSDTRGVPRVDDRRVISGIVHVLKSGCRWKDAPDCYGPRKTLYNRFVRWAAKGVWEEVFTRLAETGGPPAALMIDATHVKAHRSAAGGKGGPKRRRSGVRAADAPARSTSPSTSSGGRGG
jgi:transposase